MKFQISKQKLLVYFTAVMLFNFVFISGKAFAEEKKLCPVGKTIGVTAQLSGVGVVNVTDFENVDGKKCSPAKKAGIRSGDVILSIDGEEIRSADELEKAADSSGGKTMKLEILQNDNKKEIELSPEKSLTDGKYRIGVWIKDSLSGIGTITFYDPETGEFGALGHGICDENNTLADVRGGNIHETDVTSLRKGEKGVPGELMAVFTDDGAILGEINANTERGIYGVLAEEYRPRSSVGEVTIAKRDEVKEEDVTILSNIEGKKVEEYSAKITKINNDETDSKCMIIEITDDRLIDKTGGIIRGMSGSPILQNGKLVGAVTHVLLNDPTRGYGIFIENMLSETEKVK